MSFILNPYKFEKTQPNTFIGGIGATINTPALLAPYFAIKGTSTPLTASDLKSFKVVGSDVECFIGLEFDVSGGVQVPTANRFFGNTDITYFEHTGGFLYELGNACFRNCTELLYFKAPGTQILGTSVTGDGWGVFNGCTKLNSCVCSPVTIGRGCFTNTLVTDTDWSNVTFLNVRSLYNSKFTILNCPSVMGMGSNALEQSIVKELHVPNMEVCETKHAMLSGSQLELVDAKKWKDTVNPATVRQYTVKSGCIFNVHIDLRTINSGNADASLAWAKANRSAVINFFDDNGDYVSTL